MPSKSGSLRAARTARLAGALALAALPSQPACGNVQTTADPDAGAATPDAGTLFEDAGDPRGDGQVGCDDGWTGPECDECVTYVDGESGDDGQTGLSWDQAVATVGAAIDVAQGRREDEGVETCQVWVRAGIYVPGGQRSDSFQLAAGVHLFGGFAGGESARGERDWEANETILSGDLLQNDDPNEEATLGDNAFHVIIGADGAVLDGFTVTAGVADGESPDDAGGGLRNDDASPTLANLLFTRNTADSAGALLNAGASAPTLTDVTFLENSADESGGAMLNVDSSAPVLAGVSFLENRAGRGGAILNGGSSALTMADVIFGNNTSEGAAGAMSNDASSTVVVVNARFSGNLSGLSGGAIAHGPETQASITNAEFIGNSGNGLGGAISTVGEMTLTNTTFSANAAGSSGGAVKVLFDSVIEIRNSIFWNNEASSEDASEIDVATSDATVSISHSIVEGGAPAEASVGLGVLDVDPEFSSPQNLRLSAGSPAIDAGNSDLAALLGVDEDLDGNPRIVDGGEGQALIDLGAYEYQP